MIEQYTITSPKRSLGQNQVVHYLTKLNAAILCSLALSSCLHDQKTTNPFRRTSTNSISPANQEYALRQQYMREVYQNVKEEEREAFWLSNPKKMQNEFEKWKKTKQKNQEKQAILNKHSFLTQVDQFDLGKITPKAFLQREKDEVDKKRMTDSLSNRYGAATQKAAIQELLNWEDSNSNKGALISKICQGDFGEEVQKIFDFQRKLKKASADQRTAL